MKKPSSNLAAGEPSNKTLRWNVIGISLALLIAVALVFLLDTGNLVEWIASHRGSKIDETIAVAVVFLAGLCAFFVRRWLGLSLRFSAYSEQGAVPLIERARRGVRRDILGIGNATDQEVQTISQKSSSVLNAPPLDKPNIFRGLRVHLN